MNFDIVKTMLCGMYIEDFKKWYSKLAEEQRQFALQIDAQLYKNWLYSPLIKNTAVTPANIMYYSSGNNVIVDVEKLKSLSFKTKYLSYNEERHFIIKDLQLMLKFMQTGVKRTANGVFAEDMSEVTNKLHIRCMYYAEYLIELIIKSGNALKLPAIYTEAYVTQMDEINIPIKKIVRLSCDIVADKLNDVLVYNIFSGDDIYGYLISFNSTDLMLENMFATGKLNPLSMLGRPVGMMTKIDKSVLALFYRLITVLGEWFFTVFGLYLGIIQPMYKGGFTFSKYDYAIYSGDENAVNRIIFQCPSHFYLNNIGARLLSEKLNDPYADSFSKSDMTYILKQIIDNRNKNLK